MENSDILILSSLLGEVEKDSRKNVRRICFNQKDNTIKIKDTNNKEIKKLDLPQRLKLDIDSFYDYDDTEMWNGFEQLEDIAIEFEYFELDNIRFKKYEDKEKNSDPTTQKVIEIYLKEMEFYYEFIINKCVFSSRVELNNLIFHRNVKIQSSEFKNELIVLGADIRKKTEFKESFLLTQCNFKSKIEVKNTIFSDNFILNWDTEELKKDIFQEVFFENVDFKKDFNVCKDFFKTEKLEFKDCEFQQKQEFKDLEFNKISFNTCRFNDNVYFNNSTFKGYADFHESQFEKVACFYGVSFDKVPNFSQAIFKGSLNFVNTNLDFDFEDLERKIKDESDKYKESSDHKNKEIKKKTLDQVANDFRDSFRLFKSALIKDNNLLDASNYHKFELYAKEIELKEHKSQRKNTTDNKKGIKAIPLVVRKAVDLLHLNFYRKLCDHHTDLLRVVNNLVLLMALYFGFIFLFKIYDLSTDSSVNILNIIAKYANALKENSICFISLVLIFILLNILCPKIKKFMNKKINFEKFKPILKYVYFCFVALEALFILVFFIFCIVLKIEILFLFFSFICIYLWLVCLNTSVLRCVLICCGYIIVLMGIGSNAYLLNPLIGKVLNSSKSEDLWNKDIIIILTFVYNILLIFVLFSLQKTARKNSIVPS